MSESELIPRHLNSDITEYSNIVIGTCVYLVIAGALMWIYRNRAEHARTIPIMFFLVLLLYFVGTRVSMWVPAIKFAAPGEYYAQWFLDRKWIFTFACATGCVIATERLFDAIKSLSLIKKISFYAGIPIAAFLIWLI